MQAGILCAVVPTLVRVAFQDHADDINILLIYVYTAEFILLKLCLKEKDISQRDLFLNIRDAIKKRQSVAEESLRSWIDNVQLIEEILVWTDGAIEYEEKARFGIYKFDSMARKVRS